MGVIVLLWIGFQAWFTRRVRIYRSDKDSLRQPCPEKYVRNLRNVGIGFGIGFGVFFFICVVIAVVQGVIYTHGLWSDGIHSDVEKAFMIFLLPIMLVIIALVVLVCTIACVIAAVGFTILCMQLVLIGTCGMMMRRNYDIPESVASAITIFVVIQLVGLCLALLVIVWIISISMQHK